MKILHFEGLRGLCALTVFFVHFCPTVSVIPAQALPQGLIRDLFASLFNGDLPVFIFWLMSAHLITIKYFTGKTESQKSAFLIRSTAKRYFRFLLPVFASCFIAFLLLKAGLFFNTIYIDAQDAECYAWLKQWFAFEPSFFFFLRTTFIDVFINGNCNYNPVLWTIQTELLGSFLCFGMLSLFGSHPKRYTVYFLTAAFLFMAGTFDVHNYYYGMFVLGLSYSDYLSTDRPSSASRSVVDSAWLAVGLFVISLVVPTLLSIYLPALNNNIRFFFSIPLRAVAITLLVTNVGGIKRVLSTKPFVFLGKISFSLYLLHFLVLTSLGSYLYTSGGYSPVFILLCTLFVCLLASVLFERFVDRYSKPFSEKAARLILKE